MVNNFLLYGSNGFVGSEIARLAVKSGLRPVLGGRNGGKIKSQAAELSLDYRVFDLEDSREVEKGLEGMTAILHCAGPYIHTFRPVAEACFHTGVHYLDITGEIPVYAALAARDVEAQERNVMLMPGVGFDVVPTDCLAVYLRQQLPAAQHLSIAFQSRGPAGAPPGTIKTAIEMSRFKGKYRRNGQLVDIPQAGISRWVDFGRGPRQAWMIGWGDVFTAFYSTGIPNIADYTVMSKRLSRFYKIALRLRPLMKSILFRRVIQRLVSGGSTAVQRLQTTTHVWGEVEDDRGRKASARLHGPEAGVDWTALAAVGAIKRVLSGEVKPGFQTPGRLFGADFVLDAKGVTREDL